MLPELAEWNEGPSPSEEISMSDILFLSFFFKEGRVSEGKTQKTKKKNSNQAKEERERERERPPHFSAAPARPLSVLESIDLPRTQTQRRIAHASRQGQGRHPRGNGCPGADKGGRRRRSSDDNGDADELFSAFVVVETRP